MKIILHIIESGHLGTETHTEVSVSGHVVTVDGVPIDLSVIPEGGQAEAAEDSPLTGIVTRDEVYVIYHYNGAKAEPDQSSDWADYTFDITEGEVPCPIVWKPEPEVIEEPANV